MLILALVGGVALGVNRQMQQESDRDYASSQMEQDEIRELKANLSEYNKVTAGQRSAQADAQAKANAAAAAAAQAAAAADAAARASAAASRSTTRPAPFGPIASSCTEYTGNKAIGCTLVLQWGWDLTQMACLDPLWMHESGWNEKAKNKSSGSYGIPQALPASKMAAYGADYLTNPATQIKWGLDYIKNRYTTPCNAWNTWNARSPHWY
jgi:Transglycosylase SLT domain